MHIFFFSNNLFIHSYKYIYQALNIIWKIKSLYSLAYLERITFHG